MLGDLSRTSPGPGVEKPETPPFTTMSQLTSTPWSVRHPGVHPILGPNDSDRQYDHQSDKMSDWKLWD